MIKIDGPGFEVVSVMVVRGSVEGILNALLDVEADASRGTRRYERGSDRPDTRAGFYVCKLHTKASKVTLKIPKLRHLSFATAIIERYRRRESVRDAFLDFMKDRWVELRRRRV